MIFGTSKQLFAKTFQFPEKWRPETCTVEFVETEQVNVVWAFFPLLASVSEPDHHIYKNKTVYIQNSWGMKFGTTISIKKFKSIFFKSGKILTLEIETGRFLSFLCKTFVVALEYDSYIQVFPTWTTTNVCKRAAFFRDLFTNFLFPSPKHRIFSVKYKIHQEDQILRLVHFTTQIYFSR